MNQPAYAKHYSDDWDDPGPARQDAPPSAIEADALPHLPPAPGDREDAQALPAPAPAPAPSQALALIAPATAGAACPSEDAALWPMPFPGDPRHFPGLFARSSLFRAGRGKGDGGVQKMGPIACYGQYELRFAGPRLTMRDKWVWEMAVRAANAHGFAASPFQVSLTAFAQEMGQSGNREELGAIKLSLARLAKSEIEFALNKGAVKGRGKLLLSAQSAARKTRVAFDPDLRNLFEQDSRFEVNAARRSALSGELARWLHDFLCTNDPYPAGYKLSALRALCGFESDPHRFPARLEEAMAELKSAAPGVVQKFRIERIGRKSDAWKLHVDLAFQKALFIAPAGALARWERAKREKRAADEGQAKGPAKPARKRASRPK